MHTGGGNGAVREETNGGGIETPARVFGIWRPGDALGACGFWRLLFPFTKDGGIPPSIPRSEPNEIYRKGTDCGPARSQVVRQLDVASPRNV